MWCIICVSLWNQLFCQTSCRCIIFILVWILKSFRSNNDCLTKSKIKKIRYLKYEFRTSRRYNTRKIFLNAILLKIWGHFFLIYNENYSHYMDLPFLNFGYTFVIRYSLFVIRYSYVFVFSLALNVLSSSNFTYSRNIGDPVFIFFFKLSLPQNVEKLGFEELEIEHNF